MRNKDIHRRYACVCYNVDSNYCPVVYCRNKNQNIVSIRLFYIIRQGWQGSIKMPKKKTTKEKLYYINNKCTAFLKQCSMNETMKPCFVVFPKNLKSPANNYFIHIIVIKIVGVFLYVYYTCSVIKSMLNIIKNKIYSNRLFLNISFSLLFFSKTFKIVYNFVSVIENVNRCKYGRIPTNHHK